MFFFSKAFPSSPVCRYMTPPFLTFCLVFFLCFLSLNGIFQFCFFPPEIVSMSRLEATSLKILIVFWYIGN